MKKLISILGSTGSVGISVLKIIEKKDNLFQLNLLSANKNFKQICYQIKKFKPKFFLIYNQKIFIKVKKKFKFSKVKIICKLQKNLHIKKSDITVTAIPGIVGLEPTIYFVKKSKKILIANKESIICGWKLIKNHAKKNSTKIIPVDSEHYSIMKLLENHKINEIEKIYITASGGPFLNYKLSQLKKVTPSDALKHPKWKMGKKISIDSATMMNKVFEIIEAKNIFGISYKKLDILTHPSSYVHAILKFRDGLTNIILHDTTMKIPIYNTLYLNKNKSLKSKKLDLNILNNLDFRKINLKQFPLVKIINYLPKRISLFETIIVSANDKLVDYYLNGKIKFDEIEKKLLNFINNKEFRKFKRIQPKRIENIINLNKYVRLKIKP